jgi:hypothetical protein
MAFMNRSSVHVERTASADESATSPPLPPRVSDQPSAPAAAGQPADAEVYEEPCSAQPDLYDRGLVVRGGGQDDGSCRSVDNAYSHHEYAVLEPGSVRSQGPRAATVSVTLSVCCFVVCECMHACHFHVCLDFGWKAVLAIDPFPKGQLDSRIWPCGTRVEQWQHPVGDLPLYGTLLWEALHMRYGQPWMHCTASSLLYPAASTAIAWQPYARHVVP